MFDEFSTIQDLRAFANKIYDALYDYCDDKDAYDEDVILGISPITLEVKLDNRYLLPRDFEMYEVDTLISRGEPDFFAINDLANKYIFVR